MLDCLLLGGAMLKGPIFEVPCYALKTRDIIVMVCVMVSLNFQVKKLTKRSPFGVKTAGKVVFTGD
jgi:hypothetical protein